MCDCAVKQMSQSLFLPPLVTLVVPCPAAQQDFSFKTLVLSFKLPGKVVVTAMNRLLSIFSYHHHHIAYSN